jgi:enoyl-[acyl-carrier protein] reductase III
VSAPKATLESHIRQLAVELAPAGITANAILAGVIDTNALRQIPG